MINAAWFIPLLPLLGFLITGIGYRRIPVKVSGWIASIAILGSFLNSLVLFGVYLYGAQPVTLKLFDWIVTGTTGFSAELFIDRLSVIMLLIITGVGFLIHVYSIGYMHGDEGYNRFFSYMNLFVFFMTILVMGGSYLIMFIGWEGVGLCSYLLIGFWNKENANNDAAKKAFIMNRIGDLGFLLGMFLIFTTFGSLSYNTVFQKAAVMTGAPAITLITILLFAGATGKSAQIPLLTWLPDAMAGPTPVSALIHAATMVTAGIYMVARSNILYALSPVTLAVITVIGASTALLAAIIALFQYDIKKVLAYSTVSQLGLMFTALGVGAFSSAMFHLMTHAFFKALLFLAAGSIIHALAGEQDLRKMGGLGKKLPVTLTVFLVAALSISGIPPFAGFFSKDEILISLYNSSPLLWIIGLVISVMTAFYTFRIFYLTFTGSYRGNRSDINIHESPAVMTIPLMILGFLAFAGGLVALHGKTGNGLFSGFLEPVFVESAKLLNKSHESSSSAVLIAATLIIIIVTIASAWYVFVRKKSVPTSEGIQTSGILKLFRNRFYLDEIYRAVFTDPLIKLSAFLHEKVDLKIIDRIVEWLGKIVLVSGDRIRMLQTGNVGFYLFAMVICILAVLVFNIFFKMKL